jgi:peptidoglycan/xylan/chitin deacetylase (PgdA/CDA1 family)
MKEIIFGHTGVRTTLMRFPGGSSNTVSRFNPRIMTLLTQAVEDAGFQYFDWNVDSNDAGGAKTPDEVLHNVMSGILDSTKEHFVVLQHDVKSYSVDAVESIIRWGLENGYTFRALTEESPTCHHKIYN